MKYYTHALVIAALVLPGILKAQEGFKIGGKLGLNMANVVNSDIADSKSKLGFHVGPTLHYGLGKEGRFGIGLDVLYSQKGNRQTTFGTTDLKPFALDYIDVPLYFRYRFGFGLYLETGIDVGFLMSAKFDGDSEFDDTDDNGKPIKVKIKDNTRGIDYGFIAGLGYIHRSGFGIGYRYNLGLSNINKASIYDLDSSISLNTVGQISVMYYFKWSDSGRGRGPNHHRKVLRR